MVPEVLPKVAVLKSEEAEVHEVHTIFLLLAPRGFVLASEPLASIVAFVSVLLAPKKLACAMCGLCSLACFVVS